MTKKKAKKPGAGVLGRGEPKPFRIFNPRGTSRFLVLCDHASNRLPKSLGTLGLSRADLQRHIAWDIGSEAIARHIAKKLSARCVMAVYSRLAVDLNRAPGGRECIRVSSDRTPIPGNAGLTQKEKRARLREMFDPYHLAVAAEVKKISARREKPFLISIHTFTPAMAGESRRLWHVGILWNREEKLSRGLAAELRRQNPALIVGENQPYSLKSRRFSRNTVSVHAEEKGFPSLVLEFRQDLAATEEGARKMADVFLRALAATLDK